MRGRTLLATWLLLLPGVAVAEGFASHERRAKEVEARLDSFERVEGATASGAQFTRWTAWLDGGEVIFLVSESDFGEEGKRRTTYHFADSRLWRATEEALRPSAPPELPGLRVATSMRLYFQPEGPFAGGSFERDARTYEPDEHQVRAAAREAREMREGALALAASTADAREGWRPPFRCEGSEPEWRLSLGERGARFEAFGGLGREFEGEAQLVTRGPELALGWSGREPGSGEALAATLRAEACLDLSSDGAPPFPYRVRMRVGGRLLSGCCRRRE